MKRNHRLNARYSGQRLEKVAEERNHINEQFDQLAQSGERGDPDMDEMVRTLRKEIQALRQENESLGEKVAERNAAYEQQKKAMRRNRATSDGRG